MQIELGGLKESGHGANPRAAIAHKNNFGIWQEQKFH
jgi:hypothetical protein